MKRRKKIVVAAVSAVVTVILFLGLQRLVEPKYGDDVLEGNFTAEYYEETTEHDVIMIGDCEVYENFDPMYLWKEYGITSYIRGNAQQLVWQSYYMLEDTLKHEKPEVVIYNVQALSHGEPQKETYNRMTLDGMKWSKTKYDAIQASMCPEEKMVEYVVPMLRYHSRITELSKSDLQYYWNPRKVTHNGYYMRIDVLPVSQSDVADADWLLGDEVQEETDEIDDPWGEIDDPWGDIDTETDMETDTESEEDEFIFSDYAMQYLDRIRSLCEENDIRLILIKAPSLAPQWYEAQNQQVVEYAEKYDLEYINFYDLLDETGVDFETDTYDGGLHMNLNGADKLSEYLGNVLVNEYGVKDHREDSELAGVYDAKYEFYEEMKAAQQKELDTYGEIKNY